MTEASVIRGYFRAAKKAGWTILRVNNGGGPVVVHTEKQALEEATAAGMASVRLRRVVDGVDTFATLFFVLGNEPYEVLNDCTTNIVDDLREYEQTLEQ